MQFSHLNTLKTTIICNLTPAERLCFADLQWFNFSPRCSDVEVYSRVRQYTVASLLGVVTGNKLEPFNQREK